MASSALWTGGCFELKSFPGRVWRRSICAAAWRFCWTTGRPDGGLGRVDTFNPYKAIQFNWRIGDLPANERIGAADYPSLWNQKPREGMHLHWDGNNDSVDERNLSASLGAGVTPSRSITRGCSASRTGSGRCRRQPIHSRSTRAWPRAVRGYTATIARACHADHRFKQGFVDPSWKVGQIEPIEKIGTDPFRLNAYTLVFASNQYSSIRTHPTASRTFARPTDTPINRWTVSGRGRLPA